MYKNLIIGVTLLLLGTAGYYIFNQRLPQLIGQSFEKKEGNISGISSTQIFSGVYECAEKNGCKTTIQLILEEDSGVNLTSIIDDKPTNLGQGAWGLGSDGVLVIVLDSTLDGVPRSLTAKEVNTTKISGFTNKETFFEGMDNPSFIRVNTKKPPVSFISNPTTTEKIHQEEELH